MKLFLDSFPVGLFQCNCSILGCPQSKESIVIDPGEEGDAITKRLKAGGWTVKALIHTHAHLDHFGATADVKACCGGRSYLNKADQFLWDLHETQSMMLGLPRASVDPVEPIERRRGRRGASGPEQCPLLVDQREQVLAEDLVA